MPGSFEAAYTTYHQNNARIMQMKENNETFLSKCNAKYGPYFAQGEMSPGMLPTNTGQQARPFFNGHDSYLSQEKNAYPSPGMPRPPPYQSPRRQEFTATYNQDPYHSQSRETANGPAHYGSRQLSVRNEQVSSRGNATSASWNNFQNTHVTESQATQVIVDLEDDVAPKKKVTPWKSDAIGVY